MGAGVLGGTPFVLVGGHGNYGDTLHITRPLRTLVHSRKEIAGIRRRLGFSARFLSSQVALHQAFEPCHKLVRAERTSDCFRRAQARQCDGLGLGVDERGDMAEPFKQRRDGNESSRPPRCARRLDHAQSCGRCTSRARTGLSAT